MCNSFAKNGAFSDSVKVTNANIYTTGAANTERAHIYFNANSSNSLYTDNGKVMPLSISKQFYIIYK